MRLHFELDNKMQNTPGPVSGRNRQQARRLGANNFLCYISELTYAVSISSF